MKKIILVVLSSWLTAFLAAQTETFDIANYTPPKGWKKNTGKGYVLYQDNKTGNNPGFCILTLYASHASSGDADKDFEKEWNELVEKPNNISVKPPTEKEKTPEGWMAITGITTLKEGEVEYAGMLVTASGFGKVMSVLVKTTGSDYLNDIQNFLNKLQLDSKAVISSWETESNASVTGTFTLNDYSFIPPEGWFTQKTKDYTRISEMEDPDKGGCLIYIMAPQASSGNMETDARNFFNTSYNDKSWSAKDFRLNHEARGVSFTGLEFYRIYSLMEKNLGNNNTYSEKCEIIAISLGKQVAFINIFHERNYNSSCWCEDRYKTRDRLFNTFRLNNFIPPKTNASGDLSKRIQGIWKSMGASASATYIFAPNNRYQFIGAYGNTTRISWNTIETTVKGFSGDGSYKINGDQLTMIKDSKMNQPETDRIRFEQIKYGQTGWKDRLCMLSPAKDGSEEYQVNYNKENN